MNKKQKSGEDKFCDCDKCNCEDCCKCGECDECIECSDCCCDCCCESNEKVLSSLRRQYTLQPPKVPARVRVCGSTMKMHEIVKVVEEYKGNKTIYLKDY